MASFGEKFYEDVGEAVGRCWKEMEDRLFEGGESSTACGEVAASNFRRRVSLVVLV